MTENTHQNRVLYVDIPGRKPLPEAPILRIAGANAEVIGVTDVDSARAVLTTKAPVSVLVSNSPDRILFESAREKSPDMHNILVTESTMEQYSKSLEGDEDILLDHVIANRSPSDWTVSELRVTIQKLLRKDVFGLEKYLAPATPLKVYSVECSDDRERLNNIVMQYAEDNRLGQYLAKLAFGITEELLMNAIYDAPIAGGKHRYNELPRTSQVRLQPDEFSSLSFSCDGQVFGISVRDPFGALRRDKLYQYIKKVLRRADSNKLIDTKKGGAGLGLFKILYSSHALVCNVKPNESTEVIALIDINHQVLDFSKMPRSIHYFLAP